MELLLNSVFAHPMYYIGVLLAGTAAIGFVFFISGFSELVPALKESKHADHISHVRTRTTQGFYLMVAAFVLWQAVKWVARVI